MGLDRIATLTTTAADSRISEIGVDWADSNKEFLSRIRKENANGKTSN